MSEDELTQFNIAIMGRSSPSDYLGDVELGLDAAVGCINRARMKVVGGATYADIKTLMSRSDRVIDLDVDRRRDRRDVDGRHGAPAKRAWARAGGATARDCCCSTRSRRTACRCEDLRRHAKPLDAVAHVIGVGLVFPESRSSAAQVEYVTADVASHEGRGRSTRTRPMISTNPRSMRRDR